MIIGIVFESIPDALHFRQHSCLQIRGHLCVGSVLCQVVGLVGILLVVEEELQAVGLEDGIGVPFRAVSPPFVSVSEDGGGAGAHHQGTSVGIRFAPDAGGQVFPFCFFRHRQPHQGQKAGHDVHRVEDEIPRSPFRQPAFPSDQERDSHRFLIEDILGPSSVGSEELSVVGCKDYNRVFFQAHVADGGEQPSHIVVQVRRHGIVDPHPVGEGLPVCGGELRPVVGVGVVVGQIVGREPEALVPEPLQAFGGHVFRHPWVVGRADGQEQGERLTAFGQPLQLGDGHVRLGVRLVFVVIDLLRRVQMVIGGAGLVLVPEIVSGEIVVEAQPVPAFGDERVLRVVVIPQFGGVHMPFADIGGLVSVFVQHVRESVVAGVHADLVNHHACAGGVFAGEQRSPVRGADRVAGHGLAQVGALSAPGIDVRGQRIRVPGVAQAGIAELVGEYVDQVRFFGAVFEWHLSGFLSV